MGYYEKGIGQDKTRLESILFIDFTPWFVYPDTKLSYRMRKVIFLWEK